MLEQVKLQNFRIFSTKMENSVSCTSVALNGHTLVGLFRLLFFTKLEDE